MSPTLISNIVLPLDEIATFCQRHHIQQLSLFGSVLRDDFRQDSDVDILAQFRQGVRYSLRDLVAMGDELEAIFGRKVDLIDYEAIKTSPNNIRRKSILGSAQVIYAE